MQTVENAMDIYSPRTQPPSISTDAFSLASERLAHRPAATICHEQDTPSRRRRAATGLTSQRTAHCWTFIADRLPCLELS